MSEVRLVKVPRVRGNQRASQVHGSVIFFRVLTGGRGFRI